MTPEDVAVPPAGGARGRTTITARALRRLAVGIAGEAGHVPAREVSLHLSDAHGALRAQVQVPVALRRGEHATIAERAEAVRRAVADGMRELAGRELAAVDIRFDGVRDEEPRRVR